MPRLLNPECAAGKHTNCDNIGLDTEADKFIDCPCICHTPNQPQPDR